LTISSAGQRRSASSCNRLMTLFRLAPVFLRKGLEALEGASSR
jgi:hypothetical protein